MSIFPLNIDPIYTEGLWRNRGSSGNI